DRRQCDHGGFEDRCQARRVVADVSSQLTVEPCPKCCEESHVDTAGPRAPVREMAGSGFQSVRALRSRAPAVVGAWPTPAPASPDTAPAAWSARFAAFPTQH